MSQMSHFVLFDDEHISHLFPFTLTRPAAEIRCGILTISQKWQKYLESQVAYKTVSYLSEKYKPIAGDNILHVNGRLFPNNSIVKQIKELKMGQKLLYNSMLLAYVTSSEDEYETVTAQEAPLMLERIHHIFTYNGFQIKQDFELICSGRQTQEISKTNTVLGNNPVFLEKGAKVEASILNATDGPLYIGEEAEIMEGSMIRGPFALCEHAAVKMGAKIYGDTTVGPYSKVGGEVNNSVIFAYSNKGHDGFLGNSVLGEWCNLGADTNNSNLKNNYEEVKLWNYVSESFEKTGLQFCGLFMGDHSKCGINTMFNTGTVVGVSSNLFGAGFPRNFVPSFSWGGAQGMTTYTTKKAFQTADIVMKRRGLSLEEMDKKILEVIYEKETKYRTWEKNEQ
jgi:UDP-N-acetylglucosamine diphosphorylase/glucosamine-1-phosphate N-acetyltransferase